MTSLEVGKEKNSEICETISFCGPYYCDSQMYNMSNKATISHSSKSSSKSS